MLCSSCRDPRHHIVGDHNARQLCHCCAAASVGGVGPPWQFIQISHLLHFDGHVFSQISHRIPDPLDLDACATNEAVCHEAIRMYYCTGWHTE